MKLLFCVLLIGCRFGDSLQGDAVTGHPPQVACNADSDCSDVCAAAATCDLDSHTCVFSQPVEDGYPCAAASECFEGQCVQIHCGDGIRQTGEFCDDGNQNDDDGCDTNCAASCVVDTDCAAGNVCSAPRCEGNVCVDAPIDCSDGNSCTADTCAIGSGCQHSPVDGDADGFGPGESCGGDCNDMLPSVHPGQPLFFTMKIPGAPATSDYDYDCDGVELKHFTQGSACKFKASAFHCNLAGSSDRGWVAKLVNGELQTVVPECGEAAEFSFGCYYADFKCQSQAQMLTQECR